MSILYLFSRFILKRFTTTKIMPIQKLLHYCDTYPIPFLCQQSSYLIAA